MEEKRYDIEDLLIDFAVRILKLTGSLPKTKVGSHITNQIIRNGTAPAANYGEAQGVESSSLLQRGEGRNAERVRTPTGLWH